MKKGKANKNLKNKRKRRTRAKIKGSAQRPRLSVFRSNKAIYGQLIDDEKGKTLVAVSDKDLRGERKKESQDPQKETEKARLVGQILAEKALKKRIKKAIFDRGPFRYHGRVKALAEGAREKGLKF